MSDSALGPGGPLQDLERRPAVWHYVLGQRRRSGFPGLKYDGHQHTGPVHQRRNALTINIQFFCKVLISSLSFEKHSFGRCFI